MRRSGNHMMLLVFIALFSGAAWAQQSENARVSGKEWAQQLKELREQDQFTPELIYEPRYLNGTCPPEYTGSRAVIETFLSGKSQTQFRQSYEAPLPESISDVEPLNTKEDSEACRYFNQRFEDNINTQYKLCEDGMAWYLWDYTYYKSDVFYFVVRSGGQLRAEDPERLDCSRGLDSISEVPPVVIYLKDDFSLVPFRN